MANWLVVAVTGAYFGTAVDLLLKGQTGFAIMFFGYSIANVGLLYALH